MKINEPSGEIGTSHRYGYQLHFADACVVRGRVGGSGRIADSTGSVWEPMWAENHPSRFYKPFVGPVTPHGERFSHLNFPGFWVLMSFLMNFCVTVSGCEDSLCRIQRCLFGPTGNLGRETCWSLLPRRQGLGVGQDQGCRSFQQALAGFDVASLRVVLRCWFHSFNLLRWGYWSSHGGGHVKSAKFSNAKRKCQMFRTCFSNCLMLGQPAMPKPIYFRCEMVCCFWMFFLLSWETIRLEHVGTHASPLQSQQKDKS